VAFVEWLSFGYWGSDSKWHWKFFGPPPPDANPNIPDSSSERVVAFLFQFWWVLALLVIAYLGLIVRRR
jgi:hypothetical protein